MIITKEGNNARLDITKEECSIINEIINRTTEAFLDGFYHAIIGLEKETSQQFWNTLQAYSKERKDDSPISSEISMEELSALRSILKTLISKNFSFSIEDISEVRSSDAKKIFLTV